MVQKYIIGDIVEYGNKVMVVKEPRDGSLFDLSCPKEGLVYCLVDVDEIKPIPLTPAILEANGWEKLDNVHNIPTYEHPETEWFEVMFELDDCKAYCLDSAIVDSFNYVHQLQHLLFGLGLNSEMEV